MSRSSRDHEKRKERAVELIGKGLENSVIAERVGLQMKAVQLIRREVEAMEIVRS
jgi:DNA-binding NarL/FixJ family response regulator